MRALLLGLILFTFAQSAIAQAPPPSAIGQRVWVRTLNWRGRPDGGIQGTLIAIHGDSLLLEPQDGAPRIAVGLADNSRAFVWTGRGTALGIGAGLGTMIGVIAGIGMQIVAKPSCSQQSWMCFDAITVPGLNALAGGVAGLFAGGIIGSSIKIDKWDPITPTTLGVRPILRPERGGWSLGARVSF
ncbi:MAG: hypothetical protein ABR551_13280 [Gemmatimonadales bacterium]